METHRPIWLLLAALSAAVAEDKPSYFLVGQGLVLEPSVSGSITSILWKYNTSLLAEWVKDKVELIYYGGFNGRTTLNTNNGRLEIKNMTKTDVGVYTVEINNKVQNQRYDAKVIVAVDEPTVWVRPVACTPALENCTLTCGGGTVEAEPVSYSWREDDGLWQKSHKDLVIVKAEITQVETFSCQLENPLSKAESKPLENPFFVAKDSGRSGLWALLLLPIALLSGLVYACRHSIKRLICQSRDDSRPNPGPSPAGEAGPNPPKDPNGTAEETEGLRTSEQP